MKKYFYLMCLLVIGFTFASCDDEDSTVGSGNYVDVTLNFQPKEEFPGENQSFSLQSLILKNINTGKVISVVEPTRAVAAAQANLSVNVTVPEGEYSVDMEAVVSYTLGGKVNHANMRSYTESVTLTQETAAAPVLLKGDVYIDTKGEGSFVIAEIFFAGTETPEGGSYRGDTYFRIYNNSGDTLCADGLTIAESAFMTVEKEAYTPDVMDKAFSSTAIYRIPLGSNYMVAPGESILIVDIANNHKEANDNSFDLTKADFEWFDESSNEKFLDTDTKAPNLERLFTYSATIWQPHNRGFRSYVLARLGDSFENQLTAEEYLEKYHYSYTYNFIFDGAAYPMDGEAYQIPNEWILDAVNCSVESDFQWILTSPVLDKGWTYCGKVDGDKTRFGKSVRRKVLSGKTLQDTNNSSDDFLPEQVADPFFKFHD